MAFGLDRIVADMLEGVAGNFEAAVRPLPARFIGAAGPAERGADAVVYVEYVIVGHSDIAQDVPGHEQRAVKRAPKMMVHDPPRQVGPDAHRAIPIAADRARSRRGAIGGGALTPDVTRHLEGVRRLGSCFPANREEVPGRAVDCRVAKRDVRGRVARNRGEPAISEAELRELHESGLPQEEAVQAKMDVMGGAIRLHRSGAVQVLGDVLEFAIAALSLARARFFTGPGANIDALELADRGRQGPPDDGRERSGRCR